MSADLTRRTLLKAAAVGAGAVLLGSAAPEPASGKIPRPSSGKTYLGAFTDIPSSGAPATPAKFGAFETLIGRKLDLCMNYRGWTEGTWPSRDTGQMEAWAASTGRIPCVTFGKGSPSIPYIASGGADGQLRTLASRCKTFGRPLFLRPFWEMNGRWMSWNADRYGHDTSKFRTAWRRMVTVFANAGVTNVTWVWSPNVGDLPRESWNHWSNYYPGDAYVDWVGADGYNHGGSQWRELREMYAPFVADYGDRKPIMVAETASVERGGSKATWITNARAWVKSQPSVDAFIWFHRGANSSEAYDWRVNTSSSALSAFRGLAHDAHFDA